MRNDLKECTRKINELRKKRNELNYTGPEDLACIRKIQSIQHDVTYELIEIRAKLEVCPPEMISELKARECELLEWKMQN